MFIRLATTNGITVIPSIRTAVTMALYSPLKRARSAFRAIRAMKK